MVLGAALAAAPSLVSGVKSLFGSKPKEKLCWRIVDAPNSPEHGTTKQAECTVGAPGSTHIRHWSADGKTFRDELVTDASKSAGGGVDSIFGGGTSTLQPGNPMVVIGAVGLLVLVGVLVLRK